MKDNQRKAMFARMRRSVKKGKIDMKDIKIFEGRTLKGEISKTLEEGYFPATVKEVYELGKSKRIPIDYYDTSTFEDGNRNATKEELINIEAQYENGRRLLLVSSIDKSDVSGEFGLDNSTRLVGVRKLNGKRKK